MSGSSRGMCGAPERDWYTRSRATFGATASMMAQAFAVLRRVGRSFCEFARLVLGPSGCFGVARGNGMGGKQDPDF